MHSPSWQDLQKTVELNERLGFVLVPVVYYFIAWGVYEVVAWLTWLAMPLSITLFVLLALLVGTLVRHAQIHVKRADTATQSLRAASQGRIELVGTLLPIPGVPLPSPLYGVPCVSHEADFNASRGDGQRATLREKVFPAAVLLTDGEAEAFLPLDEADRFHTEVELSRPDAPLDLLRAALREQMSGDGWKVTQRTETIIPCDKPMQVNAVFHTLTTAGSYLEAQAQHLRTGALQPKTLEHHPVEKLWRAYCQRRQEESGVTHPVPVNALLPISNLKGIGIVRQRDANWRDTVKTFAMMLAVLPATLYLFLRVTEIIDRWDPLF